MPSTFIDWIDRISRCHLTNFFLPGMALRPPSKPVTLPPELWERLFLHLAPEQTLKLRAVSAALIHVTRERTQLISGTPPAELQFS